MVVRTSSTSSKPSSARRSTTSRTRISGTEAPEVRPTVSTPSNQDGSISLAKSTRWAAPAPASRATSLRRTEFEELPEPTTIMRSTLGAIFLTAA